MKKVFSCIALFCIFNGLAFSDETIDDANKAYNEANYEKAIKIYKELCEKKDSKACSSLGYIYRNAKGVSENATLAQEFYKKACDLGDKESCTNANW